MNDKELALRIEKMSPELRSELEKRLKLSVDRAWTVCARVTLTAPSFEEARRGWDGLSDADVGVLLRSSANHVAVWMYDKHDDAGMFDTRMVMLNK